MKLCEVPSYKVGSLRNINCLSISGILCKGCINSNSGSNDVRGMLLAPAKFIGAEALLEVWLINVDAL